MTNHRDRTLDTLSHRINRAASIVPQVLEHLNQLRSQVIALGAHAYDRGMGGDSAITVEYEPDEDEIEYDDTGKRITPEKLIDRVPVTGTERAALRLHQLDKRRDAIRDAVATLAVCVDMLDKECRGGLGMRGAEPVIDATPQCTRDVLLPDGTWVRCSRHVEHFTRPDGSTGFRESGACAMHRKREERAAKEEAA